MDIKRNMVTGALALVLLLASGAGAYECGQAPPTKTPQRIKAGESFPPLPLPATPLRRTERKNPPSPPVLIGKVICGPDDAWTRSENDVDHLLTLAGKELGLPYRAIRVSLDRFSYDPEEVPVLYITSVEAFTPSAESLKRLRNYLEQGGFLWINASSGSPDMIRAACAWLSEMYPDRGLYPVYANHPLRTCWCGLDTVGILKDDKPQTVAPDLLTLNLGCRAAVIISPRDVGCGWAMHTHPWGIRYVPEDAVKIGFNMLTYCLGWIEYGPMQAVTPVYAEKEKRKAGKIYLGQIVHAGDWDPHPSALGRLLKDVSETTNSSVYLDRIPVDLKKDALTDVPILYMTGHYDPALPDTEVRKLREFLLAGGSLIADSCCGSVAFTDGFRSLMKKVLSEAKIVFWEPGHAVYRVPFAMDSFPYTFPAGNKPPLEAYLLNGLPAALFSPYGLGGGWEGIPRPYTRDMMQTASTELGVNMITYLMTH